MSGCLQQQLDGHDNGGGHQTGSDVNPARSVAKIRVTNTVVHCDAKKVLLLAVVTST